MRRTVTTRELAAALRDTPAQLENAIKRGMYAAALRGVAVVQEEITKVDAVNVGTLRQSVSASRKANGESQLEVSAPHAKFVEFGTRPHFPPFAPIFEWAVRKLRLSEKDAKRVARAIQMKIAKDGTKPRRFMQRSMRRIARDILPEEVTREVMKL